VNKTGIYKVINGKLEKISDDIPSLNVTFGCRFAEPYMDGTLGYVSSKEDKYRKMKERRLLEYDKGINLKPAPKADRTKERETIVRQVLDGRRV